MSALYVSEDGLFSEACDVIRLFTGETRVERLTDSGARPAGRTCVVLGGAGSLAAVYENGRVLSMVRDETVFLPLQRSGDRSRKRQKRHQAKRALYRALREAEQKTFPWGSLTGIRPVKLFRELAEQHGVPAARNEFTQTYGVSQERTSLAHAIYAEQSDLLAQREPGLCVYIGIPFCPTRCRYCSFIAQDTGSARRVRDRYLGALLEELAAFRGRGEAAAAVYIGGGTPTTLSLSELERLLGVVQEIFPRAAELTLEAGRPDTISAGVIELAAGMGAGRISINPQTCHDATLARIGRAHSAADYRCAMEISRPDGMIVNNDMILGLPGEHRTDVEQTLEEILSFAPQNITVHALAVKKAADLAVCGDWEMMPPREAEATADAVRERLLAAGYRPYYLYRQKYMSGNLENVGYAQAGTACLYNVLHMEELASVAAFGAGAVSKRIFAGDRRIERSANVKNPEQYVDRLEEMIARKEQLFAGWEGREV